MLQEWKKVWGKEPSHSQWTPMLWVGVSVDSQMFRKWLQRSKLNGLRGYLYHCKVIERRCLKWVRITHLDIWNTSYGQKKGQESNWQFDFWPLKVKNQLKFLVCRWHATYHWKALNKGYNFTLDLISIEGLHTKLWGSKVVEVLTFVISRLPLGNPGTKSHLDVGFVERHIIYYKGGRWWFPSSPGCDESCESELPVAHPSTKSAPTMH